MDFSKSKWASRGEILQLFATKTFANSFRIHQEIGGGERIALLKLAAQSLEQQGRPLRIAIDVAIWQFQNQAAQGAYL